MNSETSPRICAVSFNLKFANYEPPNSWHERRPVVREWRRRYDPDIVGTQEGVYRQLRDMAADMPEYEWIGTGREGGSRGEFMAVFFKRDRFEPLEYDHYWLSDTPNVVGSSSWGNSIKRMVTWIRFLDKAADQELYVVNTHFDHVVEKARVLSAELVASRCAELNPDLPVVLLGDFNAAAERSRAYAVLTKEAGVSRRRARIRSRHTQHCHFPRLARSARGGAHRLDTSARRAGSGLVRDPPV